MSRFQDDVRREAAKLLEEKAVDLGIGATASDLPLPTAVHVVRSSEEVEELVWNRSCTANLAALLPDILKKPAGFRGEWTPPRVGILAKGCVSRSIVGLVKANQIPRESLTIVGIACEGIIDRHWVAKQLGTAEIAAAELKDDSTLWIKASDGTEKTFGFDEALAQACRVCRRRAAVIQDVVIGEANEEAANEAARYEQVLTFAGKALGDRWAEFEAEISRCVRCYACREACPNCYCAECFADETAPKWIGATTDLSDLMLFHLGRAYHQAGRCVDCGACVSACPQAIDLRLLNQKINHDVEVLFGGEVSVSLDEQEPLLQFQMEDDEGFMTEPTDPGKG
jgi:formate dehydrogenase subunit beta